MANHYELTVSRAAQKIKEKNLSPVDLAQSLLDRIEATDKDLRAWVTIDQEEVLSTADIVSLHVPLSPKTHHLINQEALGKMKQGAILINTSRGPVVDERALLDALQSGKLSGAGLDVLEKEPQKGPHPFFDLDNVVMTCHYASCSVEAYANMGLQISQQASAMLRGEFPHNLVNHDVKDAPQLRLQKRV